MVVQDGPAHTDSAETLTATAGPVGIRIGDLESRLVQAIGIIQAGTRQQLCRGWINNDFHITKRLYFVFGREIPIEIHLVGVARAATGAHCNTQGEFRRVFSFKQLFDFGGGSRSDGDHVRVKLSPKDSDNKHSAKKSLGHGTSVG